MGFSVLQECGSRLKMFKESMDTLRCEFEARCKHLEEAVQSEKCVHFFLWCMDMIYVHSLHQQNGFCREASEQQASSLTEQLQTETGRVGNLVAEVE